MPPQHGFWGDQEGSPPDSGEQPAERREDRSIGWSIANSCVQLPFMNAHLVSEHHDLDVLLRLSSSARHEEAEGAADTEVEEGEEHTR
jgi:hypothetical protein